MPERPLRRSRSKPRWRFKCANSISTFWWVLREDTGQEHDAAKWIGGGLPLVGRREELGLLVRSWEASKEGHGQAVLIQIEAGIGKSRLLEALRAHISGEEHTWVAHR